MLSNIRSKYRAMVDQSPINKLNKAILSGNYKKYLVIVQKDEALKGTYSEALRQALDKVINAGQPVIALIIEYAKQERLIDLEIEDKTLDVKEGPENSFLTWDSPGTRVLRENGRLVVMRSRNSLLRLHEHLFSQTKYTKEMRKIVQDLLERGVKIPEHILTHARLTRLSPSSYANSTDPNKLMALQVADYLEKTDSDFAALDPL